MKKLLLILMVGSLIAQDPIEVSPSSLDFGDVLMGDTPSMSFTITANLEQTITITLAVPYFTVDVSEIAMVVDQTQVVNVTFDPPSTGFFNSLISLEGSTFGATSVGVSGTALNDLSVSISVPIDGIIANTQYFICECFKFPTC